VQRSRRARIYACIIIGWLSICVCLASWRVRVWCVSAPLPEGRRSELGWPMVRPLAMRCEGSSRARLFHGAWAPARLRSGWQNLRRLRWRGFMRAPRRSEVPLRWSAADPTLAVMRSHSCGHALVGLLLAPVPKAVGRDRLALASMCRQVIANEDDDVQVCTLPNHSCARSSHPSFDTIRSVETPGAPRLRVACHPSTLAAGPGTIRLRVIAVFAKV
jgi:hypothetical protein